MMRTCNRITVMRRILMAGAPCLLAVAMPSQRCGAQKASTVFTDNERANLVTFWSSPGRLTQAVPSDAQTKGIWQVRLTPEGSAWLFKYQNELGGKGLPPTAAPNSVTNGQAEKALWKTWVQARIAADRARALAAAKASNETFLNATGQLPSRKGPQIPRVTPQDPQSQPDPGPIPASLLAVVGNPPPFAAAVVPMQHTITFEDGEAFKYTDNPMLPASYAYYRFPQGVAVYGSASADPEAKSVFADAGLTESEQRIAAAVSKLEGSFESINTYDTGFVSVGFLQFITFEDGKHSLAEVLLKEKADNPDAFATDFHKYGVDLSADGVITVVDPGTGAEISGPDAVHKIVDDKRLIAVFQRAGRHSHFFKVAQVMVAKSHYWPTEDTFTVMLDGMVLTGKVGDVVRSEAGIATLFDRKVNRGSCAPIADVVARVMHDNGLTNLKDAQAYEADIIKALKYRADFLKDTTLSQPGAASDSGDSAPAQQSAQREPKGSKKGKEKWYK
jgi:hypothetical protein